MTNYASLALCSWIRNGHAARTLVGATWVALVVAGCSGSNSAPGSGGSGVGGNSSAPGTGGTIAGGNSSATGTGGIVVAGGNSSVTGTGGVFAGGNSGIGGANATGGTVAGGNPAVGGAATTGGSTNGATSGATGGRMQSTGGGTATGGTKTTAGTTGGANATGGMGLGGGSTSTGGSRATGGAPIGGGASATGGTKAGGGTASATGGSAAGGTSTVTPLVITSANNTFWRTGTVTQVTSGTADVTVNTGTTNQDWYGFGGTFNEAGWNVLSMLSSSDRDRAMQLLFGTDGAHFVYGRLPIGASDYAMDRYTFDETSNDYSMASFSIDRDKQKLIPYIQAALTINPGIHLWASPWTPPTWMKTGPYAYTTSPFDGGNMKDDAQVLQAHALYLSKFVEEYARIGITIEAVHPQNEPGYETRYPSCLWTAALYNKFVRDYLGPTFDSRGVKAQIYLGTMSNADAGKDGTIISTVTGDSNTMKYIKGFGLQWNMITSVSGLKSRSLPIIQSEHKCGNYPWNPAGYPTFNPDTAANDYAYGVESWGLIRDWLNAGVNVYSAWNMVLDTAGKNLDLERPWPQNALLTVNTSSKALNITPAYYVFRHVSQYVAPGAKRVGTSGGDALAFTNPDGTVVAIMYNSGAAKTTYTVAVGSTRLQFSMPSAGFATVVWK
jgi:glucosylceramidase